jgi:hypothetical protein
MNATLRLWLLLLLVTVFIASTIYPARTAQLVTLSGPAPGSKLGGSGDSGLSIISRDGRYVLFASTANNLTLTNNNNFVLPCRFNVFLRDNLAQTTTPVSVNQAGTGGGNGDSFPTGISTNGQFALFESSASDLVPNDTNNAADIFVRDMVNGTTTLVSVGTNGAIASGGSRGSVITPDGRYVAFVSTATNLVAVDTNNIADVFVRDLQAGTTVLVSVGATNNANQLASGAATSSESPEITPDGRYVAFYSTATNLASGTTNSGEIYVRDLVAGQTIWASTNARAIFQSTVGGATVVSCNYSISDDGRFLAFEACTNFPAGPFGRGIILRYGLQTGLTDIINTNATEQLLSFELIHNLSMTPDGRFVAFVASLSTSSNAVYLWDAQTGTNTLVSVSQDNVTPANGVCDSPVVSSNGQFVAFTSTGTNLVSNTLAGGCHVYLRDLQGGVTRLLDADTNGIGVGVDATVVPALSADGSVVAFDCANLLPDNRHLVHDVFMRNATAGTTALISASNPALSSQTPDGISGFTPSGVSTNGRFVAFYSDADNLVPNDTNGCRDVFVRDRVAGLNLLVSVNTNGNSSGDGISSDPAISADGRYVAFTSGADNLVANDTNQMQDVFVRDLVAGTTALVSVNTGQANPGNGDSFSPSISADGRYVLFHSKAYNVYGNIIENLFFRDLQAGATYALTALPSGTASGVGVYSAAMTPDGQSVAFIGTAPGISGTHLYVWNSSSAALTYTNNSASFSSTTLPVVAINANGQKLAYLAGSPLGLYAADVVANTVVTVNATGTFLSHAGLRFSNDGRYLTYATTASATATNQMVNLWDLQAGTNLLVSQNFSTLATNNAGADSPGISPNGRFVAYRSFATNLVAMDSNTVPDLFVYDAVSNATYLVSLNASGSSSADDRSLKPVFSGDSQTLYFQSWASDLSGGDYNNGSDLFAVNLALPLPGSGGGGSGGYPSGFYAQLIPAGAAGPNPVVSWTLAAGEAYQVQFKTNLTDAVWLNLPGNMAFIGLTGYLGDSAPAPGQRFYRILSNP